MRKQLSPKIFPRPVIIGFFLLGFICALAFRSIIVLQDLYPGAVRGVWYFAVIGYIFFFFYRYLISLRRKRVINENDLIGTISRGDTLSSEQKRGALYLLRSIKDSKENLNYLAIFIFSVIAVLLDIFLRFRG